MDAAVVLSDNMNHQWIFKTADNIPALHEVRSRDISTQQDTKSL